MEYKGATQEQRKTAAKRPQNRSRECGVVEKHIQQRDPNKTDKDGFSYLGRSEPEQAEAPLDWSNFLLRHDEDVPSIESWNIVRGNEE